MQHLAPGHAGGEPFGERVESLWIHPLAPVCQTPRNGSTDLGCFVPTIVHAWSTLVLENKTLNRPAPGGRKPFSVPAGLPSLRPRLQLGTSLPERRHPTRSIHLPMSVAVIIRSMPHTCSHHRRGRDHSRDSIGVHGQTVGNCRTPTNPATQTQHGGGFVR